MSRLESLAFVDIETTGLSPVANRIAEIGVITVDANRIERWTTLIRTTSHRNRRPADHLDIDATPAFEEIAAGLARRLTGRLMVAHNARFDHAFLRAEFDRVGIALDADVLCSVMLSRKLYPELARHDLDSLIAYHGLRAGARHRALPDADLVWQWWELICKRWPEDWLSDVVNGLVAGPMLPAHLAPSLIDKLPEAPAAYVFHGERNEPLCVGAAGNLKRHVLDYFRVDRATSTSLEYSHRITNITYRRTGGIVGARLHAAMLGSIHFARAKRELAAPSFTWQFSPDAIPAIAVAALSDSDDSRQTESFGVFSSERRARNALLRLAARNRLCHCLLGVAADFGKESCVACAEAGECVCADRITRNRQLLRICIAIEPFRVSAWPYRGPVGIRERSDMHVVDRWRFLGTARDERDLHELLDTRAPQFDTRIYALLKRAIDRLPQCKIVDLYGYGSSGYDARSGMAAREPPATMDEN